MYRFTFYWIILIALKWFFVSLWLWSSFFVYKMFAFCIASTHKPHTSITSDLKQCVCESADGFWMINHLRVVVAIHRRYHQVAWVNLCVLPPNAFRRLHHIVATVYSAGMREMFSQVVFTETFICGNVNACRPWHVLSLIVPARILHDECAPNGTLLRNRRTLIMSFPFIRFDCGRHHAWAENVLWMAKIHMCGR